MFKKYLNDKSKNPNTEVFLHNILIQLKYHFEISYDLNNNKITPIREIKEIDNIHEIKQIDKLCEITFGSFPEKVII